MRLLKLRQALDPGDRRRPKGFGGPRRHGDLPAHSRTLSSQAEGLRVRQQARSRVLGVDPKLVFVLELGASVDRDEFRRAGLQVLDGSDRRLVVAFSDDPQLAGFLDRLAACAGGIPPGGASEPYAAFVDAVDGVRPLEASDRISPALAVALRGSPPQALMRLDAELWYPDSEDLAHQWVDELRGAVRQCGGHIPDVHISAAAGVILARVYLPADQVLSLAELDAIALLDILPTPALSMPQFWATDPDSVPTMSPPRPDAPLVGLIDSGVSSAHPLVGPAVVAAEALSPAILDGEDRCGHGTMVAGLILHGPMDQAVARGVLPRPLCRIISVAALDGDNLFPEGELWERDLVEAIEWCASQGARIINLSLGDDQRPLRASRQLPAAALVDELARRLDLVVVIASGNCHPGDYLTSISEDSSITYPVDLVQDHATGILDPGTAALALTVGGITAAQAATGYGTETVLRRPMGEPGWPSPVTRRGPGIGKAVKPELVEHSGTLGIESGRVVSNDPELGVISTKMTAGRLLGFDVGTSYAAPLVTRIAAALQSRHPTFSANMIKALVLLSAQPSNFALQLEGASPATRAQAERDLTGYGRPSLPRALESTSHRAVLVAESRIRINGVHIYEAPFPTSFATAGGVRGIDIALAYSPRTRLSRLDYVSNRMEFALIRGMVLPEVIEAVAAIEGDEGATLEPDDEPRGGGEYPSRPPTLSQLGSKVVTLMPSGWARKAGTNQVGRVTFRQRLDPQRHAPMFVVVRNVNRWEDDTTTEPYALAVAMWRSPDQPELYVQLEAELEAVIEVPIEVELEV